MVSAQVQLDVANLTHSFLREVVRHDAPFDGRRETSNLELPSTDGIGMVLGGILRRVQCLWLAANGPAEYLEFLFPHLHITSVGPLCDYYELGLSKLSDSARSYVAGSTITILDLDFEGIGEPTYCAIVYYHEVMGFLNSLDSHNRLIDGLVIAKVVRKMPQFEHFIRSIMVAIGCIGRLEQGFHMMPLCFC